MVWDKTTAGRPSVAAGVLCAGLSLGAQAIDWSEAAGIDVDVFFPGQTSMEWILSKRDHDGAARFENRKKNCRGCHDGDEQEYGPITVAGSKTEPEPLGGRRGYTRLEVKAANDGTNMFVRVEWEKAKTAAAKRQDEDFDTKLTMMLGDGKVELFQAGGCWAVCHADAKQMPHAVGKGLLKYLENSRTKMDENKGGGSNYKPDADLDKLFADGVYLEYWQARLNPGKPAEAADGTILNEREDNDSATVTATATEQGEKWVVEFSRPLAGGARHKALREGRTYTIGFALHDQGTKGRYHLVSLQYALRMDEDFDAFEEQVDLIAAVQ